MNLSFSFRNINDPQVREAWLGMESADTTPYLRYNYLKYVWSYTRRFAPYEAKVACVSSQQRIVMIVPVKYSLFRRYWKFLGDLQGCNRTDALFLPELSDDEKLEASRCFLSGMKAKGRLNRLQDGSVLRKAIPDASILKESRRTYVHIPIQGNYESYFSSLSSSVRQNVRTAYNRMRRDGHEFVLRVFEGPDALSEEVWKAMMDVYCERLFGRYKKKKIHGVLSRMYWKNYYHNIKFDTKALRQLPECFHAALYDGDRIVAMMSGLKTGSGKELTVPRLAIDIDYRFYSPGYILVNEVLKFMYAEGRFTMLDLGRGDERYKSDMGGVAYTTTDMVIKGI